MSERYVPTLPFQAESKGPRRMPRTVVQETVAKEDPSNLCQALRWSLPALPSASTETKAITELELKSNALNTNSINNLLKVINGQVDLLTQTLARIPLCHQSEISRATNELRQENDQLRRHSGLFFRCAAPISPLKEEPIQEKETPQARARRLAAGNPQGKVVIPAPALSPVRSLYDEVPQLAVAPSGMHMRESPDQVLWPPPDIGQESAARSIDLSTMSEGMRTYRQISQQSHVSFDGQAPKQGETSDAERKGKASERTTTTTQRTSLASAESSNMEWPKQVFSPRDEILPMWAGESSEPLAEYKEAAKSKLPISVATNMTAGITALKQEYNRSTKKMQEELQERTGRCRLPILHPHSLKRLIWDMMGGIFIFYDVIVIPLQFLPMEENTVFTVMQYITVAFWSMDIPRQFLIGYEVAGGAEMRLRMIACNYAKTWMIPDLAIVCVDWLCMFVITGAGAGPSRNFKIAKTFKALRLLRLLRLARVMKVPGILSRIFDHFRTEYHLLAAKLFGTACVCGLFAHYAGCYFYVQADLNVLGHGTTWLIENGFADDKVGVGTIYITGLQWATARSSFNDSDIRPTNVSEHLYTMGVALAWLVIICFVASFFTISVYAIRESTLASAQDESLIRKYLSQHAVSRSLQDKIMQHYRHDFLVRERILHEQDLGFVRELPNDLRIKLHTQVFLPVLRKHPAFMAWSNTNSITLLSVCHLCCEELTVAAGAPVFQEGEECRAMLHLRIGNATYFCGSAKKGIPVPEAGWISEACLWQKFVHGGTLMAITSLEMMCVDASNFIAVVGESADNSEYRFLQAYAETAVIHFAGAAPKSDLWEMSDISLIVRDLQRESSMRMSSPKTSKALSEMGFTRASVSVPLTTQ